MLESLAPEVSIGYETIRMYKGPELESAQVGYAVTPAGESLTGDGDGDWLSKWLVIGYEELCGDPIFIDTSCEEFPVYTAMHGEGRWDAKPIAVSLAAFGKSLSAIAQVAKGRAHPKDLEQNPLTSSEKQEAITAIRRENPGIDLVFLGKHSELGY